jgi:hypothetical protein
MLTCKALDLQLADAKGVDTCGWKCQEEACLGLMRNTTAAASTEGLRLMALTRVR